MLSFGTSAVNGPYGWTQTPIREKSSHASTDTHEQQQQQEAVIATMKAEPIKMIKPEAPEGFQQPQPHHHAKKHDQKHKLLEKLPTMSDGEIIDLLQQGTMNHYMLEKHLPAERSVKLRRMYIASVLPTKEASKSLETLPFEHYNYDQVTGVCCENVIGYVPIPVGVVGMSQNIYINFF